MGRPAAASVALALAASSALAYAVHHLLVTRRPKRRRRCGTLWASPVSTCSRRVILALEEAETCDYVFEPIDLLKREHKSAHFIAMQPYGKVPVWSERDGPLLLFESRAIMRHVAAGSHLIPSDPALVALMDQWISVEYSYFYPEFLPLFHERVLSRIYKGSNYKPDEAVCAARVAALEPTLDLLEHHLSSTGGPYLVGSYSLADVTFTPYLDVMGACRLSEQIQARPALAAWIERCLARPAWRYCLDGTVMNRVRQETLG